MHDHSDKIQPKKLLITIILAILLLGYAYVTRDDRNKNDKNTKEIPELNTATTQ